MYTYVCHVWPGVRTNQSIILDPILVYLSIQLISVYIQVQFLFDTVVDPFYLYLANMPWPPDFTVPPPPHSQVNP